MRVSNFVQDTIVFVGVWTVVYGAIDNVKIPLRRVPAGWGVSQTGRFNRVEDGKVKIAQQGAICLDFRNRLIGAGE